MQEFNIVSNVTDDAIEIYNEVYMKVSGWLRLDEAIVLSNLAHEKKVFEIGAYCGLSTIIMAHFAKIVFSVDHFKGDEGTGFKNTQEEFFSNVEYFESSGMINEIIIGKADFRNIIPFINLREIDLIYYDASHDYESVESFFSCFLMNVLVMVNRELDEEFKIHIALHDYKNGHKGTDMAIDHFIESINGMDTCKIKNISTTDSLIDFEFICG